MHHSVDALKYHLPPRHPRFLLRELSLPSADLVMGPSWMILNIL